MPGLFERGTLDLPVTPPATVEAAALWSECAVNRVAVIAVTVLLVLVLSDLLQLMPLLLRCLSRWKGNIEIEHNIGVARTRSRIAVVCGLCLCIIADRYTGLAGHWTQEPGLSLAVSAAILAAYTLARRIIYLVTPIRKLDSETASALRHSLYNYSILCCILLLVSIIPMAALSVPDETRRIVILAATGLVYFIFVIRAGQIIASRYAFFRTFLYLCALEFLPAGILLISAR